MTFLSQFAAFFQNGGPFMYVILGISVLGFGTALERFWVIGRASSWNGRKIVRDLVEMAGKGDLRGAVELARNVKSPIGQVAHPVLGSVHAAEPKGKQARSESTLVEQPQNPPIPVFAAHPEETRPPPLPPRRAEERSSS